MSVQFQKVQPLYPQLQPRPSFEPQEEGAVRVDAFAAPFLQPSAPLLSELEDRPLPPPYEEPPAYEEPGAPIVNQYVPVNPNHIDFDNPLIRLANEPEKPLGDRVADAAGSALNAAASVAPQALNVVGTVATTVAAPVANLAWNVLRGAGNLMLSAVAGEPVDPEVLRRRQLAEARLQQLTADYRRLQAEEWEYDVRELAMSTLPAVTGYLFGGVFGLFTGGAMGYLTAKVFRSTSQAFSGYKQKGTLANQIRNEVRNLSALLGVKEPKLRPVFR